MAAVHVGVGHDDDLAVAQVGQHLFRRIQRVGVDAQGHRHVVHFVVAENLALGHFPGVQHLAAQGQDGLELPLPALLGGAAGGIPFHQEEFVPLDVFRFAIRQLARQHGGAGLFLLLHHLAGLLAGNGGLDGQVGDLPGFFYMRVEPGVQRVLDPRCHQAQGIPTGQLVLGLALELGVQDAAGEHETHAAPHILRLQAHLARQQAVMTDEFLQRFEHPGAQARLMGTAQLGRDEVHVGFAGASRFAPGQGPGRPLPIGEARRVRHARIALRGEDGAHIARLFAFRQRFLQIGHQAVGVLPDLFVAGFLVGQHNFHARQQHRLGPQESLQFVALHLRRIEILHVRPGPHQRAAIALPHRAGFHQGLHHVARGEHQAMHLPFPLHGDFQPGGQGIGHGHAHAVQAAGEGIGAAGLLVELAAGVEPGEHHFHRGHAFNGMDAHRNTPAVILH